MTELVEPPQPQSDNDDNHHKKSEKNGKEENYQQRCRGNYWNKDGKEQPAVDPKGPREFRAPSS